MCVTMVTKLCVAVLYVTMVTKLCVAIAARRECAYDGAGVPGPAIPGGRSYSAHHEDA